jgi:hypothetical protein
MNDINLGPWIRYRATVRRVTYHSGGQREIRRAKTYETTSERSIGVGEVDTSSVLSRTHSRVKQSANLV